jgi:Predicted phosphatase/phosphohexomutase
LDFFGLEAKSAIAFEDSPNRSKAARAAGMHTVIVPNELTQNLSFDDYSLRIHSMLEIEFERLLHILNASLSRNAASQSCYMTG